MTHRRGCLAVLALGLGVCGGPAAVAQDDGMPPAERQLVDKLIDAVGKRSDCTFIRNGSSYSAEDAAVFLRRKFEAMGSELHTAEDFIERIASKSSMSGEPYRVKMADGREMLSAQFMHAELQRLRRR